ncbi:hypothetical protein Tco_0178610 [Tanacetum coccineum]
METLHSPNESNEAISECKPSIFQMPNHVEDAHDPNEMVDIPNDEELVDYDGDDEEEPEEESEERTLKEESNQILALIGIIANIQLPPAPEIRMVEERHSMIFPYEVEGDQTPPPPAESSDSEPPIAEPPNAESSDSVLSYSESSNSESMKGRESSSVVRDSSYVGGLEPWALRRYLEATRTRKGGDLRGEKERKILDYDLGNVKKTLSNVVERLKILESGENATLKKKLKDKEMQLAIARSDCDSIAEHKIQDPSPPNHMLSELLCVRDFIRDPIYHIQKKNFLSNMNRRAVGADPAVAGDRWCNGIIHQPPPSPSPAGSSTTALRFIFAINHSFML